MKRPNHHKESLSLTNYNKLLSDLIHFLVAVFIDLLQNNSFDWFYFSHPIELLIKVPS